MKLTLETLEGRESPSDGLIDPIPIDPTQPPPPTNPPQSPPGEQLPPAGPPKG